MESRGKTIRVALEVSSDETLRFLERLAEDDDFRGRLARIPETVLREYGIELTPSLIPRGVELPAKEQVRSVIDEIERTGAAEWRPSLFFHVWFFLGFAEQGPEPTA